MSGLLFIVSAPSGAGKTSLVRELLRADPGVGLSVSYTTRPARPGEQDGKDYHFVGREAFQKMIEQADFLESAQVHGNYYGTSERWVRDQLRMGKDIVLEIDWQGAQQVRQRIGGTISVFILPPSFGVLEQRLKSRAQDGTDVINTRLAAARDEIAHAGEFDYAIINDHFDTAVRHLCAVVQAARLRTATQLSRNPRLLEL
jgi:guanylate kinase